ncbi:hypothetical protein Tco_1412680 [Tanacetum coccineum]
MRLQQLSQLKVGNCPRSTCHTGKGASYIEKEIEYAAKEFNTSPDLSSSDDTKKEIKLEDLSKLVHTEEDQAEEVHTEVTKETEDASASHPPSLRFIQTQELTNLVLLFKSNNYKLKQQKLKAEAEVALLSSTILSKCQVSSVQAKIKTLDALTSLLSKKDKGKKAMYSKDAKEEGTESKSDDANLTGSRVKSSKQKNLKQFDFIIEKGKHIHLIADQIKEQNKLEELAKADMAKQEVELGKEELVDLLGINVVKGFYKAKLEYDKYCDKMLNRRVQSKITNCNVLTRKGPSTLKVYREDGTNEIILDFKATDLHLSEWREVMQVCPNRKGAGWSTIYGQIKTRMDYLHKTEAELEIDFSKPLSEQDPLDKLNDLARKKRKHANDIHDYFRSTKKFKSSVQYEDHPAGTVLNEPCLGMIMFNSVQRQDFVTIEDFGDFSNKMLYIVQEIFFKLHQRHGLDDHARTFSSFLLAEVDKKNPNPLK